ncbi:hypothetical protein L6164_037336 [Bauhinia variegata]|uniref:Uncharacterized protein n=1 Tax=Bauhinia variegata TaxID=167791 RepID=A0ACB9KJK7_BAUVA|nr:hypothetical protein L6164_037336 [Bauhinia variegata]
MIILSRAYVDDLLLTGDNLEEITDLKHHLDCEFKIKDFGDLHFFLALEFIRTSQGLLISQKKYTLDLCAEFQVSHMP